MRPCRLLQGRQGANRSPLAKCPVARGPLYALPGERQPGHVWAMRARVSGWERGRIGWQVMSTANPSERVGPPVPADVSDKTDSRFSTVAISHSTVDRGGLVAGVSHRTPCTPRPLAVAGPPPSVGFFLWSDRSIGASLSMMRGTDA